MRNGQVLCNMYNSHHPHLLLQSAVRIILISLPPPHQSMSSAFCGPKMMKEPLFGDSSSLPSLLAPRASPQTAACSHDLVFLFARHARSWPALGVFFNHATIYSVPWSFLSSGGGSVYAAHFLPLPNDKHTRPFCFVGFTENHQGEKEKITKYPRGRDVTV